MSATIQIAPMALLEARLVQKLEEKIAEGWKINPDIAYNENHCICCLLGAQVSDIDDAARRQTVIAERHGISSNDSFQLEQGFMNHTYAGNPKSPYWQLGNKLRKQYVR